MYLLTLYILDMVLQIEKFKSMQTSERIPIESAVDVLKQHMRLIDRVSEWAEKMGSQDTKKFSRQIRDHYGVRPKKLMTQIKLQRVKDLISNDEKITFYEVAKEVGKKDEQALYHFVMRATGHPPSKFRTGKK